MNCPVCKTKPLNTITLEENLPAYQCQGCEGIWLSAVDYFYWLEEQGPILAEKPASEGIRLAIEEVEAAKLCPKCRHLLMKYKVGHQTDFSLERCGKCHSVWLDKNKWQVLKSRHLHDKINRIITEPWQRAIREEEHRQAMRQIYTQRFGEEDYAKLRELREWLRHSPQSGAMFAYLMDADPYG